MAERMQPLGVHRADQGSSVQVLWAGGWFKSRVPSPPSALHRFRFFDQVGWLGSQGCLCGISEAHRPEQISRL